MTNSQKILAEYILKAAPKEGLNPTAVPGMYCIKFSKPNERTKGNWRSSFAIIVQGRKELELENNVYRYEEAHYIASPVNLLVASRVKLGAESKPFLALIISLDPIELTEIAVKMKIDSSGKIQMLSYGIFTGKTDERMLDAAVRLVGLQSTPDDVPALAPLIRKELFYQLLKGPNGRAILQFSRSGSKLQRISQAIQTLRSELTTEIDIAELAKQANMSRSSFFNFFKEVTAMSPIQYQKRLRLVEARRLLLEEGESAEGAAYKVGYNSASQFNREYSRMFGSPPLREAAQFLERGKPLLEP